jgi:excisionase family DNA binding protein
MAEAKEIPMNAEPTVHSLMAELKQHLSSEIKDYMIERPHNVKETASYMGIHEQTLYKWMREGVIPKAVIHRIGSAHFFFLSEMKDFIQKR